MTTAVETDAWSPVAATRLAAFGLLATAVSTLVNALVRAAATALFDVPADFGPLGLVPIVNTTVVGVAGATGVYWLLVRVSRRPNRDFAVIAAVVLLLSFTPLLVPPGFLAGAPTSVLLTLGAMHVTTAAVVVRFLPRSMPTGGRP